MLEVGPTRLERGQTRVEIHRCQPEIRRNGIEIVRRFIELNLNAREQRHRGLGLRRSAREISQTVCEIVRRTNKLNQTRRDPPWMGVETIPRRRETGQIALEFRQMIRKEVHRAQEKCRQGLAALRAGLVKLSKRAQAQSGLAVRRCLPHKERCRWFNLSHRRPMERKRWILMMASKRRRSCVSAPTSATHASERIWHHD